MLCSIARRLGLCVEHTHIAYTNGMRVLLTEGSGLTSRQVAGLLRGKGHDVGVVSCDPLGLTRFTAGVRRWHRVGAFGVDPLGWLDSVLDVYRTNDYDLLFPTQEQVAVLSSCPQRLIDAGVMTVVPAFSALLDVQDKLAARATLQRLGITQPESAVVTSTDELAAWDRFPVYIKTPIGTATTGVHRVTSPTELQSLLTTELPAGAFDDGGILAQSVVSGPLVMVQSVFDHGRMVAAHANLRVREGARGGASHKRSIDAPRARQMLQHLGSALHWHGALSADVILTDLGPLFIDINPRLVEPMNAYHSGVDLVGALIDTAQDVNPSPLPDGQAGIATHQLLLAVLGAAQSGRGRRGVARELRICAMKRDEYHDSVEELTPLRPTPGRIDWRTAIPPAVAAAATLTAPSTWRRFASTSVTNYALTPSAWRTIQDHAKSDDATR